MPDRRRACLLTLGALTTLTACGSAQSRPADHAPLLQGARRPIPLSRLEEARVTASQFAKAYAASVYDPAPPPLPGATGAVNGAIRFAAARIPPPRIGRRAHPIDLNLAPESPNRIRAAVRIDDGRSPSFSVGFTLRRFAHGWRVTAISPPG